MLFTKLWLTHVLALLAISAAPANAGLTVPSDDAYLSHESSEVQYIYSPSGRAHIHELETNMRFFMKEYERSFNWKLDAKLALILPSERNQIANGFATVMPLLQTVFYPSGSELLDQFAEPSFLYALASHETAHLYQLNVKTPTSSWVSKVLGNTMFWFTPIGLPIFIHPNIFTPTFLLEGNAVMNESRFGHGGRLWSGEVRAEVLAQIKNHDVTAARLMNHHIEFPFGREKYHQGGYLMRALADRFGVDRTNSFFATQAHQIFLPLILNDSFLRHFGESYNRIIYQYTTSLDELAQAQKTSETPALVEGKLIGPFNHDDSSAFFWANEGGDSLPRLYVFDKNTQKLSSQSIDLEMGKAFRLDDGHYYTATSAQYDAENQKYSLFGEGLALRPEFLSQLVMDRRGGHLLSVDTAKSFAGNQLVLDGQSYDLANSSAILDEKGNVYYFRQSADQRVLYRNHEALFNYRGFYGKLTEVDADGAVYFVASTQAGSSLFVFRRAIVERALASDTVVDARRVGPQLYLTREVGAGGLAIHLVPESATTELPYFDEKAWSESVPSPAAATELSPPLTSETPYSSLTNLRYSATDLQFSSTALQFASTFVDPMVNNGVSVQYRYLDGPKQDLLARYFNSRYRLSWSFGGFYRQKRVVASDLTTRIGHEYESGGFVDLSYDLFAWRRWRGELGTMAVYELDQDFPNSPQRRASALIHADFDYTRFFPLAYDADRRMVLSLIHKSSINVASGCKYDEVNAASLLLSGDMGWHNYLALTGSWAAGETNSIKVDYDTGATSLEPNYLTMSAVGTGQARDVREWSLQYKRPLAISHYFKRFPVSLRRLAPFARVREVYAVEHRTDLIPLWTREVRAGIEGEFLFAHNFPFRMSIAEGNSTQHLGHLDWFVQISTKTDF